jgi:hypothetical protein
VVIPAVERRFPKPWFFTPVPEVNMMKNRSRLPYASIPGGWRGRRLTQRVRNWGRFCGN